MSENNPELNAVDGAEIEPLQDESLEDVSGGNICSLAFCSSSEA